MVMQPRVVGLRPLARYGTAIALVLVATALRVVLSAAWGVGLPYITFYPAVAVSAWLGGVGPGIVATGLSAVIADYLWVAPAFSFAIGAVPDALGLLVFTAMGVLISSMNEAWRRSAQAEHTARQKLEIAAQQLQTALHAGRMGTWEYGLRTGTVTWSAGLEAIHGYGPGTFGGTFEAFRNEIHPEDRDRVLQAIAEAVEQRHDHHIEYRIVRTDGAVRWVEGRGQLFLDRSQQPERMVGVCTDITQRKQAEERFRMAVDAAPAAMLMVDQAGTIVLTNALTEQLLGYTRDEMMGQPIDRLVPPRVRERHSAYRSSFFSEPRQRPMGAGRDLYALRRDGSEVPVEIGLSPIQTDEGTFVLAAVTDITARKSAETLLRARTEELERVLEVIPTAVVIANGPDFRTFVANKAALRMAGIADGRQPAPGETPIPVRVYRDGRELPEDDRPTRRVAATGRAQVNEELEVEYPDGGRATIFGDTVPLLDSQGRVRGVVSAYSDVTERKRVEQALRESRRQMAAEARALARLNELSSRLWRSRTLREGLDEMLAGTIELLGADMGSIHILDDERRVLCIAAHHGVNEDFLQVFRQVPADDDAECSGGWHAGDRIVVEDIEADGAYAPLRPAARKAGFRSLQSTPLVARNGTPLGMLSTHGRSVHRPGEQELRRLDLYARQAADFIERFRIDEALRAREGETRRQLTEIHSLYDTAPSGLCVFDREFRFVRVNPALGAMNGVPPADHLGRTPYDVIPAIAAAAEHQFRRVIETGAPVRFEMHGTTPGTGGEQRVWDEQWYPLLGPDGSVMAVGVIVDDITERKQLEQQRAEVLARERAAREELDRASRVKDDFLAVLSHELRTPLNAVVGYAHLLATGTLQPDRAAHAVDAIQRNAQAQARLVESLIDLSRIMAGKLELELQPLDLSRLLDTAVDVIRPDANARGVVLEVIAPSALPTLLGDAARLQQVFWNLLSNAIKFTPSGGRIGVRAFREEDHVAVQVTDTGQGITAGLLPLVFERFRQGGQPKDRSRPGLGLGLALVREMVQAHGGTVVADSPGEGQGSTFTVRLPLSQPIGAVTSPEIGDSQFGHLSQLDILIVDDDGDARDFLTTLLDARGAAVRAAASAAEALEAIARQRPDVLLADLGMPEEDGYSLIRKVRAREQQQNVDRLPAIAVTAYATVADREHALVEGYDWHVAKPIHPAALARAIMKVTTPQEV